MGEEAPLEPRLARLLRASRAAALVVAIVCAAVVVVTIASEVSNGSTWAGALLVAAVAVLFPALGAAWFAMYTGDLTFHELLRSAPLRRRAAALAVAVLFAAACFAAGVTSSKPERRGDRFVETSHGVAVRVIAPAEYRHEQTSYLRTVAGMCALASWAVFCLTSGVMRADPEVRPRTPPSSWTVP